MQLAKTDSRRHGKLKLFMYNTTLIKHSYIRDTLSKLGIKGNFFNSIKYICKKKETLKET